MRRSRDLAYEPNIRATASSTLFYISNSIRALTDWLVENKGMENEEPQNLGRHYAVVVGPRMELVVDTASLGGWQIRCLGPDKEKLASWVTEFSRLWEDRD